MVENESEQKKRALLYIKTLQEFKQTGERLWQENPPTDDPEDPSYFIPSESASHKFIDLEEQNKQKKKRKSQGKRKNQEDSETPQKKNNVSAQESTKPNQLQSTNNVPSHETPVTPVPPITPVTPVTPVLPVTPATQKGKGKTSTLVVTPNPNNYGPFVPDVIEKALLETEVPNTVMYNNRIQDCYYEKCHHKWDPMFMISPNNMLFRMKTYRKYTRKSDGI